MKKYMWIVWFSLVDFLGRGMSAWVVDHQLFLYIPSGATTENSRMYLNLVRQFNQDHKDAAVQFIPMDNYNEVLETVLALHQQGVGNWVAVVEVSELMMLKDAGAVLRLDAIIAEEPEGREAFLQRFFPGFLANCRGDDGNYYALPFYRSTPIIYYNLAEGIPPDQSLQAAQQGAQLWLQP